jgi:hypothetical protein
MSSVPYGRRQGEDSSLHHRISTSKVICDQFVKPPIPITDYLTQCVLQLRVMHVPPLISDYNPGLQLFRYHSRSSGSYNHDACRRTSPSPHAHNAIDNPARSLDRVGLMRTPTLALMMHRHRLDLPSPTRAPAKAGIGMAYAQVARSHHTGPQA